ncbi:Putative UROD/MetE-like superfamily protein [Septoria linicola]|uniref:UROD/MetE-like superfamily protein n=1 Tax=Septoria linicola TaxID=215465 RepID=A0A9Q9AR61_9PEZI|nr:putative UROD/MetE-like superfamily protein [Septoria linicola]USW50562.1 Putative UROD/MetE-like superfamily protein [Septoria linicola]
MARALGCHLVGSVPLPDTEAVFRQCLAALPGRLKRIPDGETGVRHYFTLFQAEVFNAYPAMKTRFEYNAPIQTDTFTPEQVDEGVEAIQKAGLETGYDKAAIDSYAVFSRLRDEGVIPHGVRMQVCVPTVANVLFPFVQKAFQVRIEPICEEALFRAIRNIQDAIPHADLAIQIDIAGDTAFWEALNPDTVKENSGLEWYKPWWEGDVKSYMVDYIVRMISQVDEDVELGLHNCYGDMDHKHWHEPASLAVVVERQKLVTEASPRKINWSHMPVPKSAVERPEVGLDKYLSPLHALRSVLEKNGTELYLGCVHEHEPQLTKQIIEAAERVVPGLQFGVGTECGGGRMTWAAFEDALKTAADVSSPVL